MKEVLCGLRVKVKDALGALVSWLGDKRGKEMNITEWALTECQLDAFIYIFLHYFIISLGKIPGSRIDESKICTF